MAWKFSKSRTIEIETEVDVSCPGALRPSLSASIVGGTCSGEPGPQWRFLRATGEILAKLCWSEELMNIVTVNQFSSVILSPALQIKTLKAGLILSKGVQPFGISGPHWEMSCLGPHMKYTNTNKNKNKILIMFSVYDFVLGCVHSHPGLHVAHALQVGHP